MPPNPISSSPFEIPSVETVRFSYMGKGGGRVGSKQQQQQTNKTTTTHKKW